MSLADLEDAVTAPTRWLSLASKSQHRADNVLVPSQTRTLQLVHGHDTVPSLYLVPGGRFLITFADSIKLFDVSRDYISPRLIAEIMTPFPNRGDTFLDHASVDGEGIRIFASESPNPPSRFPNDPATYTIYEVFPNHENPQIVKVASLKGILESYVRFWSLSFDRLVFLEGSILKIWDYKADTWGHWKVTQFYEQIVVAEDALILLCRSRISIWKPPALSNQKPRFSGEPPLFSPYTEIPYPLPPFQDDDFHDCAGPCDWYSGTAQPLLYDLIIPQDDDIGSAKLTRFEVILDGSGNAELRSLATLGITDDMIYEPYRISQGTLTAWWHDGAHIRGRVSSTRGTPMAHTVEDIILFNAVMDISFNSSSFCPSSGRLVCLDHEGNVQVIDFLTPRSRQNETSSTSL
ncbi:hypothetical protein M413DRAFT_448764 [Hebeloma cylindrosporum]|uniref:CNH domain-containing protein n=1 Tax=Hebeloma cylindrosporum TaxID=76867 RepID=A0A0C3BYC5_HEBCY|nr:hypothetical protein M413DRAFT_448764 [Hebeloma cylindrosporum h7]